MAQGHENGGWLQPSLPPSLPPSLRVRGGARAGALAKCGSFLAPAITQHHFSRQPTAAGAVAAILLQLVGSSSLQPPPTPLPIEGLWGCCSGSHPPTATAAAAAVPQWLQQLSTCSSISATAFTLVAQLLCCCSMWIAAHSRCGCSSCPAAGVLQQQFSYCLCGTGAAVGLLLQYVSCSSLQPTRAELPMRGLWGCCTSSLHRSCRAAGAAAAFSMQLSCSSNSAAAFAMQAQQPLCCCSMWAAAYGSQPPPRYQCRGYGSAAPAAFKLASEPAAAVMLQGLQQLSCCSCHASAFKLLLPVAAQ